MANEFIWHDPVEAQQAMTYAANAAKADAMKQENLYRMAELGLRRQQQQETAQLNQLITASQLQQRQIENQFREKELMQRADLETSRNKNYLEGLRIQFPEGRVSNEALKQQYDENLRRQQEAETLRIVTEAESALDNLNKQESQLNKIKTFGGKNINKPVLDANLSRVMTAKRSIIDGLAQSGLQYNPSTGKFIGIKRPAQTVTPTVLPTVSQLQTPPPSAPTTLPQVFAQPNIPVPDFLGSPAPSMPDTLPRYETVQDALAAGHKSGDIVRVKHPITGVYARYQIE